MKTLGVIGGLGPMATVRFLELVTEMSDAQTDQEHMEILIHSKPQIPDRTRYILGKSVDNPVPEIVKIGKQLAGQGADVLAVPCITAHYFHRQISEAVGIPVINAVEETIFHLKNAGIKKAGIMATDGTIKSRMFQDALSQYGMEAVIPDSEDQKKVMHIIYDNVKSGNKAEAECFDQVSERLLDRDAQVILLACTELSLVKKTCCMGPEYLDVLDVLARKAVLDCGRLRKEYYALFA